MLPVSDVAAFCGISVKFLLSFTFALILVAGNIIVVNDLVPDNKECKQYNICSKRAWIQS